MEDNIKKNNNNKIEIHKNNKEENNISILDSFINDIDIIPLLKESILFQKKLISFIIDQFKNLKNSNENKEKRKSIENISEKIFSFLIKNYKILGISFFSLLIEEEEFSKNIIFGFYNDNIFKKEILSLIHKIIEIFNFDFDEKEINNPIDNYYKDLINYGIIKQKDLIKNEKRENLTEEEQLYVIIESILFSLIKYRELGNDVENDASEFFNSEMNICQQNLNFLKFNKNINNATIEYFQEKIEEIKNFKNKKINENKNIENNKKKEDEKDKILNIKDELEKNKSEEYEEEEEDEEILTKEQILEEIKEFRKYPLKERTYFYKDEQIIDDENEFREFKNYYFPLGIIQKEELSRQFCSFINSKGGRLYIGINDKRFIKGVVANERVIYYEKKIFDLVDNFYPKINPKELLKFYAIPIRNNQNAKIIDNLFVFKIIIKKGNPSFLYSISNNGLKCTIRIQGQCVNLTAEEIHKEIIERKKYKINNNNENIEDDYEIIDPFPYITQKIIDNEERKRHKSNNINNIIVRNINNIDNQNNNIQEKDNTKDDKIDDRYISDEEKNKDKKNKKKNKKKNRKNNKNKDGIYRIEITNIDKNVDENRLKEIFGEFNYDKSIFFKNQNGLSNGYMDFIKEEDADNFVKKCDKMSLCNRTIHLNKISFK